MDRYDLLIIGRGIVGLAHALAGAKAGMRVAVLDREERSVGASVRNFGFVTVTGQQAGATWTRSKRARDVWAEIAPQAGIPVLQRGLLMCARRTESEAVLEEFASGPMGEGCTVVRGEDLPPGLAAGVRAALISPHELRVDSRVAIPRLAAHLEQALGVTFLRPGVARAIETGVARTTNGPVAADHIVVCPGPDLRSLFPEVFIRHEVTLCKLHMMRVAGPAVAPARAVMSDLGLVRYLGYADCPSLGSLKARLRMEQPQHLADGIHLIAVANADGSLVVGDSHSYGQSHDPFQADDIDQRILSELSLVLDLPEPRVLERWTGVYPTAPGTPAMIETPMPGVRLVQVTSGTGASTAFAIAEETLAETGRGTGVSSNIQAAILDWAGTIVDHGSLAPMGAFVRAFSELGVDIDVADARGPMGMAKRDHIRAVLAVPGVSEAWRARYGSVPDEAAVERVFAVFEPLNADSVVEHATMIPGAEAALAELAAMDVRVGSTTGYTRPIMRRLMPVAAAAGYVPEVVVCAGDLAAGRPSPLMMWHAMAAMGVWPASTVVKVDDTPVGLAEGRAAGTWTVGVALTGNIAGLDAHDLAALSDDERATIRTQAMEEFGDLADLVVDSIADLPAAIRTLDARLAAGDQPMAAMKPAMVTVDNT